MDDAKILHRDCHWFEHDAQEAV